MSISYKTYQTLSALSFEEAVNQVADGTLDTDLETIHLFYDNLELVTLSDIPLFVLNLDNAKDFKTKLVSYFNALNETNQTNVYGFPTITVESSRTTYGAQGDEYEEDVSCSLTMYRKKFILNNEEHIELQQIMSKMRDELNTSSIYVERLNFDYILRRSLERYFE